MAVGSPKAGHRTRKPKGHQDERGTGGVRQARRGHASATNILRHQSGIHTKTRTSRTPKNSLMATPTHRTHEIRVCVSSSAPARAIQPPNPAKSGLIHLNSVGFNRPRPRVSRHLSKATAPGFNLRSRIQPDVTIGLREQPFILQSFILRNSPKVRGMPLNLFCLIRRA